MSQASSLRQASLKGASGLTIAADVGGPTNAPLIIFSHGGGQTRFSWRTSAQSLADRGYAVLSYDHRGHGQSDWSPERAYSEEHFAADLEALIATVPASRPIALVGASLGGASSLLVVSRKAVPQLRGLVLVDVTPRLNRAGVDRIRRFMDAHPQGFETLDAAADAIAAYRPERPKPADLRGLAKNLRKSERTGRYHWHWDPELLNAMSGELRSEREAVLEHACRDVTIPTLLVRGALSDVVSEAEVEHLESLIPHLERADVAAAGHMVVSERNDSFLHHIVQFLNRVMPL